MLYFLFSLSAVALSAVAVWVWTVGREAVKQITENTRRPAHRADWTDDPDAPVPFWLAPVDEPVYGHAADRLRDDLRRKAY